MVHSASGTLVSLALKYQRKFVIRLSLDTLWNVMQRLQNEQSNNVRLVHIKKWTAQLDVLYGKVNAF